MLNVLTLEVPLISKMITKYLLLNRSVFFSKNVTTKFLTNKLFTYLIILYANDFN
ncbi:hypothetical protein K502DRAFT_10271 [Neoconidiobolus thromboides FSU 785]|nr:hypothetical protein K502DRAFT_10271 [Neoconidiobolus thromboides FSU 785]